jgi:hypothetical protein
MSQDKIPIKIAQDISEKYGYAQVIIVALSDNDKQDGWVTTYDAGFKPLQEKIASLQNQLTKRGKVVGVEDLANIIRNGLSFADTENSIATAIFKAVYGESQDKDGER